MIFAPDIVRTFPVNSDTGKIERVKIQRNVSFLSKSGHPGNANDKTADRHTSDEDIAANLVDANKDGNNNGAESADDTSSDGDYDTDLDKTTELQNDGTIDGKEDNDKFVGKKIYLDACEKFGTYPQNSVLNQLERKCLTLSKRSLGPEAVKPICVALLDNLRVQNLILDNTDLQDDGAVSVLQMMFENMVITRLNISSNSLGFESARLLALLMAKTTTLQHLNVSDNNFDDESIIVISKGLARNESLQSLNLSKNTFGPEGSKALGAAIAQNETLTFLDVNWNYIRGAGSVGICKSFKDNLTLHTLHIAWNGLGYEGTVGVADAMKGNLSLVELDISFNRINWHCAEILAKALRCNNTLEVLIVGNNPLTTTGAMDIVTAVSCSTSKVRFLSLMNVSIIPETELLAMAIQTRKKFKLIHGGVVSNPDVYGERKEKEIKAMERILNYMKTLGIRPVELMREFDKTVNFQISEQDFIKRIKSKGIKLHNFEMVELARSIATRDDGSFSRGINYRKLVDAVSDHVVKEREEKIKVREREKKIASYHRRLLSQKLPSEVVAEENLEDHLEMQSDWRSGSQMTRSVASMSSLAFFPPSTSKLPNVSPQTSAVNLSTRSQSSLTGTPRTALSLCGPLDRTQSLKKKKKRIKTARR